MGTPIRHASSREELSSSALTTPHQANVPHGAADRRFSLPATLPATHPENHPENRGIQEPAQPTPAMVHMACSAPDPLAWHPACPHRLHESVGCPPCYLCSVLDLPPKYRKREARGWQRVKNLVALSIGALTPRESEGPQGQRHPITVNTVSEWPLPNVPGVPLTQEAIASSSSAPDCWTQQERDIPGLDVQETRERDRSLENNSRTASQLPDPAAYTDPEGGPCLPPLPLVIPLNPEFRTSPPPYTPPPLHAIHPSPHFPPREPIGSWPRITCTKNLLCQLIYAFILAMAFSTLVISFDQSVIIITSVVVSMAIFIFLPFVVLIECLIKMKVMRDFRHHTIGLINTPPRSPGINPIVL